MFQEIDLRCVQASRQKLDGHGEGEGVSKALGRWGLRTGCLCAAFAFAAESPTPVPRSFAGVCVLDFAADAAFVNLAPVASGVGDLVTAELARLCPGILDRSVIRRAIEEQRMVAAGLTAAGMLRLSKMMGVRLFVRGAVMPGAAPSGLRANARLFDSETFETLAVVSGECPTAGDIDALASRLASGLAAALCGLSTRPPAQARTSGVVTPEAATSLLRGLEAICRGDTWAAAGFLCDTEAAAPGHAASTAWMGWLCAHSPQTVLRGAVPAPGGDRTNAPAISSIAVLRPERLVPSLAAGAGLQSAVLKPTEGELLEALESAVLAAGFRLPDTEGMAQALAEQDLKLSGIVDPDTAARYNRALMPDAVLAAVVTFEDGVTVVRLHLLGFASAGVIASHRTVVDPSQPLSSLRTAADALLAGRPASEFSWPPPGWRATREPPGSGSSFAPLLATNGPAAAWTWMETGNRFKWPIAGALANRCSPAIRRHAYTILEAARPEEPEFENTMALLMQESDAPLDRFAGVMEKMPASPMRLRLEVRLAHAHILRAAANTNQWEMVRRRADAALGTLPALPAGATPERSPATPRDLAGDLDRIEAVDAPSPAAKPDPERRQLEALALAYRSLASTRLGRPSESRADAARLDEMRRSGSVTNIGVDWNLQAVFLQPQVRNTPSTYAIANLLDLAAAGWTGGIAGVRGPVEAAPDSVERGVSDSRLGEIRRRWLIQGAIADGDLRRVRSVLQEMHRASPSGARSDRDAMVDAYFKADTFRLKTRGSGLSLLKEVLGWYQATADVAGGVERLVREPLTTSIHPRDLLYAIAQSPMKYWDKIAALKRVEDTYREIEDRRRRDPGAATTCDAWRAFLQTIYWDMAARDETWRLGVESIRAGEERFSMGFEACAIARALERDLADPGGALKTLLRENGAVVDDGKLYFMWLNALGEIVPKTRPPERADYERLKAAIRVVDEMERLPAARHHLGVSGLLRAQYMIGLGEQLDEAAGLLRDIVRKGGFGAEKAAVMLEKLTAGEQGRESTRPDPPPERRGASHD